MKDNLTPKDIFLQAVQNCDSQAELSELAATFVVMGLGLLRGTQGHEFTDNFLKGASADKNPIIIEAVVLQ